MQNGHLQQEICPITMYMHETSIQKQNNHNHFIKVPNELKHSFKYSYDIDLHV